MRRGGTTITHATDEIAEALRTAARVGKPRLAAQLPELVADIVSGCFLAYVLVWGAVMLGVPFLAFARWYVRLWGLW
jgi:hypothetical protein